MRCLGRKYVAMLAIFSIGIIPNAPAENADELFEKATALFDEGKFAEVLPILSKAAELAPKDEIILIYRGAAHSQLGDAKSAIADFLKATKLNDESYEAH